MQIQDITLDIEQSLASLTASALPPALQGLRHLPTGDYEPRVSIQPPGRGQEGPQGRGRQLLRSREL